MLNRGSEGVCVCVCGGGGGGRFSLRDMRVFEISKVEITRVDCITHLCKCPGHVDPFLDTHIDPFLDTSRE